MDPLSETEADEISIIQFQKVLDDNYDDFLRLVPVDDIVHKLQRKRILSNRDVTSIQNEVHENDKVELLFKKLYDHRQGKDFLAFCQLLQKHCVLTIKEFGKKMEVEVKHTRP